MKNIFVLFNWLILLALCITFTSCEKDDQSNEKGIIGIWTLDNMTYSVENPKNPELAAEEEIDLSIASALIQGRATWEFKKDGSFINKLLLGQKVEGKYTYDGSRLSLTFIDEDTDEERTQIFTTSLEKNILTLRNDGLDEYYDNFDKKTYRQAGFTKYEIIMILKK